MDKGAVQRIVQRYRSPYTAVGWAFVKALGLKPRPPLPRSSRTTAEPSKRDISECMGQTHGVCY